MCIHSFEYDFAAKAIRWKTRVIQFIGRNICAHEIQRLCVESYNGCQIDHPSQRQHGCPMMDEYERWQMYMVYTSDRTSDC
jgi:hypothetical protein